MSWIAIGRVSVLKQGGHKNGHSRLFLGCFWIAPKRSKLLILFGGRGRNRTYNLSVKSRMLCQLSYASNLCGRYAGGVMLQVPIPWTSNGIEILKALEKI